MNIYTLHFDGACGPKNPGGTAAYGFVLSQGAEVIQRGSGVVGSGPEMSNNVGEYAALFAGLEAFNTHLDGKDMFELHKMLLQVRGDSKLVINQMNKIWKVRDGLYVKYYERAAGYVKTFRAAGVKIHFDWIPRKLNQECDDLSKENVTVT